MNVNEQLTKNFSLKELTVTNSKYSNIPDEKEICNLRILAIKVLQPARELLQSAIYVTSGFRSKAVNKAVGGVATSQHCRGEAADLTTLSRDGNIRLFNIIKELGEYDQLISEHDYSWIHVSYTIHRKNRNQILHIK